MIFKTTFLILVQFLHHCASLWPVYQALYPFIILVLTISANAGIYFSEEPQICFSLIFFLLKLARAD